MSQVKKWYLFLFVVDFMVKNDAAFILKCNSLYTVTAPSAFISPGEWLSLVNYNNSLSCNWTISTPVKNKYDIVVLPFDYNCVNTGLFIVNPEQKYGPFQQSSLSWRDIPLFNPTNFSFQAETTDTSVNSSCRNVLNVYTEAVNSGCGWKLLLTDSDYPYILFPSPNYPGNHDRNNHCMWILPRLKISQVLNLIFTSINRDNSSTCNTTENSLWTTKYDSGYANVTNRISLCGTSNGTFQYLQIQPSLESSITYHSTDNDMKSFSVTGFITTKDCEGYPNIQRSGLFGRISINSNGKTACSWLIDPYVMNEKASEFYTNLSAIIVFTNASSISTGSGRVCLHNLKNNIDGFKKIHCSSDASFDLSSHFNLTPTFAVTYSQLNMSTDTVNLEYFLTRKGCGYVKEISETISLTIDLNAFDQQKNYLSKQYCSWYLYSNNPATINIDIKGFDVNTSNCESSIKLIFDNIHEANTTCQSFRYTAISQKVLFVFQSDDKYEGQGFNATISFKLNETVQYQSSSIASMTTQIRMSTVNVPHSISNVVQVQSSAIIYSSLQLYSAKISSSEILSVIPLVKLSSSRIPSTEIHSTNTYSDTPTFSIIAPSSNNIQHHPSSLSTLQSHRASLASVPIKSSMEPIATSKFVSPVFATTEFVSPSFSVPIKSSMEPIAASKFVSTLVFSTSKFISLSVSARTEFVSPSFSLPIRSSMQPIGTPSSVFPSVYTKLVVSPSVSAATKFMSPSFSEGLSTSTMLVVKSVPVTSQYLPSASSAHIYFTSETPIVSVPSSSIPQISSSILVTYPAVPDTTHKMQLIYGALGGGAAFLVLVATVCLFVCYQRKKPVKNKKYTVKEASGIEMDDVEETFGIGMDDVEGSQKLPESKSAIPLVTLNVIGEPKKRFSFKKKFESTFGGATVPNVYNGWSGDNENKPEKKYGSENQGYESGDKEKTCQLYDSTMKNLTENIDGNQTFTSFYGNDSTVNMRDSDMDLFASGDHNLSPEKNITPPSAKKMRSFSNLQLYSFGKKETADGRDKNASNILYVPISYASPDSNVKTSDNALYGTPSEEVSNGNCKNSIQPPTEISSENVLYGETSNNGIYNEEDDYACPDVLVTRKDPEPEVEDEYTYMFGPVDNKTQDNHLYSSAGSLMDDMRKDNPLYE